jgi:predicted DNA-binding transcriptional regulator AlpA
MAATNLTELVTERQVSERWNVSLNTLRYWRSTGEGPPYVKIGRSVRYNVSALEKYLRRNTCESKTRATAEEALQRVAH